MQDSTPSKLGKSSSVHSDVKLKTSSTGGSVGAGADKGLVTAVTTGAARSGSGERTVRQHVVMLRCRLRLLGSLGAEEQRAAMLQFHEHVSDRMELVDGHVVHWVNHICSNVMYRSIL